MPLRRGRQARARWGWSCSGRKTLKSAVLAMVVSIRRTLPALSYILMELPLTQCSTRIPSGRWRKLPVSSPVKLRWALRPRKSQHVLGF